MPTDAPLMGFAWRDLGLTLTGWTLTGWGVAREVFQRNRLLRPDPYPSRGSLGRGQEIPRFRYCTAVGRLAFAGIGARQIICTFFGKREVLTASFMQRPDKGPGCSKE